MTKILIQLHNGNLLNKSIQGHCYPQPNLKIVNFQQVRQLKRAAPNEATIVAN